jgi:hypothetical protein
MINCEEVPNMIPQVNESDWKLFRSRLPAWQEGHMEALIRDYAVLLTGSGAASDKFWALEKRIREDQQHVGVVARMSRSNMYTNLLALLQDGVITLDDLEGFSDDLRERFAFVMRDRKEGC